MQCNAIQGFYAPDEFKLIDEAYRYIFGPIRPKLRACWDLNRKRPLGRLPIAFERYL